MVSGNIDSPSLFVQFCSVKVYSVSVVQDGEPMSPTVVLLAEPCN